MINYFDYCNKAVLLSQGNIYERIKFGQEPFPFKFKNCPDCGVPKDSLHKRACDIERCPICFGQLYTCNCIFEEELECDREK